MASSRDKQSEVSPATSTSSVRSHFLERSPSLSSTKEDKWPELLLSRPDKSYYYSTKSSIDLPSHKRSLRSETSEKSIFLLNVLEKPLR
ncbi:hypothetical protein RR46_03293 [Papilio xuthus]|uniref:Uncharacterized protein n=1 Tax=Papilio xuthus TaxID=66420 RepID=A0A194Q3I9_PAPXU|nr:hypothetical protein RR46_03293 [Papilio xuthus]